MVCAIKIMLAALHIHIPKEERKTRKRKKKAFDQAADCGVKVLAIFFDTIKMNQDKSKNIDKPAGLDLYSTSRQAPNFAYFFGFLSC
jgi:hypothetical protein